MMDRVERRAAPIAFNAGRRPAVRRVLTSLGYFDGEGRVFFVLLLEAR